MQPSLLSVRWERSFKTGLTFRYSFCPLTIQFCYSLSGWPMTKDAGQGFQFPIPETKRAEWLELFCATISGIVWVDQRYLWLVNGFLEYHRPIRTNTCLAKHSQQSLRPKLVPILLRVTQVVNDNLPKIRNCSSDYQSVLSQKQVVL